VRVIKIINLEGGASLALSPNGKWALLQSTVLDQDWGPRCRQARSRQSHASNRAGSRRPASQPSFRTLKTFLRASTRMDSAWSQGRINMHPGYALEWTLSLLWDNAHSLKNTIEGPRAD
jgi:hypothetical protein